MVFETGVLPGGPFLPGQTVLQSADQLGQVLEPMAQRLLASIATPVMLAVGIVEMAVGVMVITSWARLGANIASLWLALIALTQFRVELGPALCCQILPQEAKPTDTRTDTNFSLGPAVFKITFAVCRMLNAQKAEHELTPKLTPKLT